MIVAEDLHEIHVGSFRAELRVPPNLRAKLLHHRVVGVRHEKHRVRHARIERMDRLRTVRKRHLLVKPEVRWLSETDRDAITMEVGGDNARFGLKAEVTALSSALLDKPRKTTRAIAAHFGEAAIVVVKLPRPISLSRDAGNEEYEPIRANTTMPIAKAHDLTAAEADGLRPIIEEHKIIARAVHLGEFQNHGCAS
jgi:hypothetical protein